VVSYDNHCSEGSPVSSWSPLNCKITVGSMPELKYDRKDHFSLLHDSKVLEQVLLSIPNAVLRGACTMYAG
jgi:hypothetical protein